MGGEVAPPYLSGFELASVLGKSDPVRDLRQIRKFTAANDPSPLRAVADGFDDREQLLWIAGGQIFGGRDFGGDQ